jgi:preprotein translocase subunit SecD
MKWLSTLVLSLSISACATGPAARDVTFVILEAEGFPGVSAETAMVEAFGVVRRRIDGAGVENAIISRQGGNRIRVEAPDLAQDEIDHLIRLLLSGDVTFNVGTPRNNRIALRNEDGREPPTVVFVDPILVGSDFASASTSFDEFNRPSVSFQLTSFGAKKFGFVTLHNVGRQFAIVFNDEVISAPIIQTPITDERGMISGAFTFEVAQLMAAAMSAHTLLAGLKLVQVGVAGKE